MVLKLLAALTEIKLHYSWLGVIQDEKSKKQRCRREGNE